MAGSGIENALAAVWDCVPVQRCTVHKHRNLLAHAPERLHDEITADYTDMIYAATPEAIAIRRKAFIRKWRLRHRAVADSLEEAGDRLLAFCLFTAEPVAQLIVGGQAIGIASFGGCSVVPCKLSWRFCIVGKRSGGCPPPGRGGAMHLGQDSAKIANFTCHFHPIFI